MLAAAVNLGLDPRGYERPDHRFAGHDRRNHFRDLRSPAGARRHGDRRLLGADLVAAAGGAGARLCAARHRGGLQPARARSGGAAARMPASPRRCWWRGRGASTRIAMRALAPELFVKGGAEGVHCAALPGLGLGIALKIDDGAKRGAERALAELLAALLPEARSALADQLEARSQLARSCSVGRSVGQRRSCCRPSQHSLPLPLPAGPRLSGRRWRRPRGCDRPRRLP